ncbi:MAG: tetratricopeptide repeat protein [Cyclobacteriaceae bacterium]|nr:tetratricopeptide repeat protein [Cyclobacteriaceae bacterium]
MMRLGFLGIFIFSITLSFAQSKPSKVAVMEALGDTLAQQENFAGALKQYAKVIKATKLKTKEDRKILYKRALCLFYLGEFDKALNDLNAFISENENIPQARLFRAFLYRELGDTEKQLADVQYVTEHDPFNPDLLKWEAGLFVETGMNREAVTALKKIKQWGTDEEVEFYLGLAYYGLADADSAIFHFDEAIALNGGYVPAYTYAGVLCLEEGAYELALTYINLALRLDAGNPQLLFYKGIALVESGKKDEGCSCLNRAFYAGIDDAGGYLEEFCFDVE